MKRLPMLTLAAIACWPQPAPAAVPADGAKDPGTAALQNMTDAQRAFTEALAREHGARPEDVALMRQSGYGWDDAGQAATLAAAWDLKLGQVASANQAGHSWKDVHEAAKLAVWSGFSFETVLALRESGLSWPEVAAEVKVDGVDLRDAPRDPSPPKKKAVPPKKPAKPAKAPARAP